jgi:carbon monoxide dehydrogenase subunit G
MKLEGIHQLHASRKRICQLLADPRVLQRCIPGCERLEATGDGAFATTMRAGVGSIKGIFNGNVRLEEMRPPEHYRIVVDGKGTPGFMTARVIWICRKRTKSRSSNTSVRCRLAALSPVWVNA